MTNFKNPSWKVKHVRITKRSAKKLLEKNLTNRKVNQSVVDSYCRVMDSGLWHSRPTQTPILVDTNGFVHNGQHRLYAFLASKLDALTLPFVFGCDPSDYNYADQDCYPRSRAAQFRERSNVPREMARVRALEVILTGDHNCRVPNSLFQVLTDKTYKEQLEWAEKHFRRSSDHERAAYVAAFMYVYGADKSFAESIADSWVEGGGKMPSVMLRFRDEAIRNGRGGAWTSRNETLRMLNGLMSMHRKGATKTTKKLLPNTTGLEYWSKMAKDGVIDTWKKREVAEPVEAVSNA